MRQTNSLFTPAVDVSPSSTVIWVKCATMLAAIWGVHTKNAPKQVRNTYQPAFSPITPLQTPRSEPLKALTLVNVMRWIRKPFPTSIRKLVTPSANNGLQPGQNKEINHNHTLSLLEVMVNTTFSVRTWSRMYKPIPTSLTVIVLLISFKSTRMVGVVCIQQM